MGKLPLPALTDRFDRWLPALATCALVLHALAPIADSDVPMHAAVGRYMVQHRALLPTPDPLVWTDHGGDQPHEWMAQAVIGMVADGGGLGALRPLLAVVAALCGWILLRIARMHGLRPHGVALLVLAWTVAVAPHLAMRPHVFGWMAALAVLGLGVGDPQPWSGRAAVGWLALVALWANLHASVLIAPVYALLAGVDLAWQQRRDLANLRWQQPALRVAVCGAGALCQPMGWRLLPYVAQSQAINGALSDEWQPLLQADVLGNQPLVLWVWAVAAVAAVAAWRQVAWPGAISATCAVVHAAATRRMTVFLFVPVLAGLTALGSQANSALRWTARLATLGAIGAASVSLAGWVHRPALDRSAYPQQAAAFLKLTDLHGRLFNPDPWGGYLSWVLDGRQRVFLDGRWLLAGRQTVADGIALQARQGETRPLFAHYGLEIFVQRSADFAAVPPPDPAQWSLAWQDPLAVVLVARGRNWAANRAQICDFYQQYPALTEHGHWPTQGRAVLPAAQDDCRAAQ